MVTALCTVFLLLGGVSGASGRAFAPPGDQVFAGVAGAPISAYTRAVGKHPAVYEEFIAWGQYLPAISGDAVSARSRLMIHITTAFGSREAITPGGIAAGRGDAWLVGLNRALASSGIVTYVRLMAEMDAYWNPYSAFASSGSARDLAHSTATYKRAWKRVTLILRGGDVAGIDAQLHRLGMPPLQGAHAMLPAPAVAMQWVPQVAGAPDVAGNQPLDYWPGRRWVDWVGTDGYSRFPNFSGLNSLYRAFPGFPFVFGEYALWGEDSPGWVDQLFGWARAHPRARMLIYNQGLEASGPFRLSSYPAAARELRRILASPRFPAFAPEWAR